MLTVTQKFSQRVLPLGLVVVVGGMCGLALVAYFASDIVEFFTTTSASATRPDFYPAPIIRAP
jgi:hypothetical protein